MIKSILVPATGSQSDDAVFASALTVARKFAAHLDFLHVRGDATAMAATMASEGSSGMITGLLQRLEEEADRREAEAKQLFQRFCAREGLSVSEAPSSQLDPSAHWLREIGDERY